MADLDDLKDFIAARSECGAAVAFSGGADSSVLLAAVSAYRRESGEYFPFLAFYARSAFQAGDDDVFQLRSIAEDAGAEFVCFPFDPLKDVPELVDNPPERCYFCKKFFLSEFVRVSRQRGIDFLSDGTNADDLNTYRPGRRALAELGILSPFAELGIRKMQIREMARTLHLACAAKPASPCLATRFEYGMHLTTADLERVAAGEVYLRKLLPPEADLRLRVHRNGFARIETDPAQIPVLAARSEQIAGALSELGFGHITLDLAGFRSGSMDDCLKKNVKN